jgi:hypothetical protein
MEDRKEKNSEDLDDVTTSCGYSEDLRSTGKSKESNMMVRASTTSTFFNCRSHEPSITSVFVSFILLLPIIKNKYNKVFTRIYSYKHSDTRFGLGLLNLTTISSQYSY